MWVRPSCARSNDHEIPAAAERPFIWGVWAEVDEDTFFDCRDERDGGRVFRGVLSCVPPVYEDSQPEVEIRPRVALRPLFTVLPPTHPIALHQARGLKIQEIVAIAENILHRRRC